MTLDEYINTLTLTQCEIIVEDYEDSLNGVPRGYQTCLQNELKNFMWRENPTVNSDLLPTFVFKAARRLIKHQKQLIAKNAAGEFPVAQ